MGILLFVVLGIIVILILIYFKKHSPAIKIDREAWDDNERMPIKMLKQRVDTGDITQHVYDD